MARRMIFSCHHSATMMAPHPTPPTPFQWGTDSVQIRPQPFEDLQTISALRTVDETRHVDWTGDQNILLLHAM